MTVLPSLPDAARIWIFPLLRSLDAGEEARCLASLTEFAGGWKSHKEEVTGGAEILYARFLVLSADVACSTVSGCSIDGLFRHVERLAAELGAPLGDNSLVYFRAGPEICAASREDFQTMCDRGEVRRDMIVFNNAVTTLGDIRSGRWELPLRDSWHDRAFPVTKQ